MRRAVAWSAVEATCGGALSLLSALAVARLIGPSELGIAAASIAVHVVLWVAVNALFADALVQIADLEEATVATAFWSGLGLGVATMAGQAASGPVLAALLGDDRMVTMALLLAAPLPLVGVAGVAQGRLTRARDYRALALRTILGQGGGTAVGVGAALAGAGAWAAVAQQAVTSAAGAASLVVVAGAIPAGRWRPRALRALLAVGLPLTASTLLQIARYRLFAVLIGASAGPAVLGQVHMAFRLVDTARDLAFTALWRLFLPDLSRCRHDRAAMLVRVDRLLRGSSLVLLPACAALALAPGHVVTLVLGHAWQDAARAAVPLVGLMAVLVLMFPSGVALVALGQARFTLYGNAAGLAAVVAGAVVLRPADAWHAVLLWCGAQLLVVPYALFVNGRALGVGPLRPLRAGLAVTVVVTLASALGGAGIWAGTAWHNYP